ncbi:ribonuclease Y [Entomospira culicis]|uniref:Ribonuclease Y n=1 Tax=Entomospira culicis TaxID=2719989 RepID=A0A968GE85_9SPIO|nr:ribonuclease Y [Entomospira culicis]NIZ18751.1 ribonuclease Y [Entomospira culicis]NIZ68966.1 ribonuclease Y [Entomospira culicis]WDI37558.1 ribonuclease Y [Entomospira culicis]WDI39186.1 ribonuclease Y [Entomospira culicis]
MLNMILLVFSLAFTFFIGWISRWFYAKAQAKSSEQQALKNIAQIQKEAENERKELLLDAQSQLVTERKTQEKELRDQRQELQRLESRLLSKEDNLDRKMQATEKKLQSLSHKEKQLEEKEHALEALLTQQHQELERVAGLTIEEAKEQLILAMEDEARRDARTLIGKIEQETKETAEKKARDILVTTIQRLSAEVTSDITVTAVSLPNDEMKGRIIGREGRNIRTLETLTGVDIIIDDTPEVLVLSAYDPVRKAIAKAAIERLVSDGRIHPTRIEEVVQKITKEFNQLIFEEGDKAAFELGLTNLSNETLRVLGRLHFRSSYGQNVLAHSKEVSKIAGMIAAEVGANREVCKRAGLFHDVGKGVDTDGDGNHAEVGAELMKKLGEKEAVVHAIMAHHNDVEPRTPEAIIIQVADAISASRPGARRETLDGYIKRLEALEKIANSYQGVERAFAVQAGRELRILVNHEDISDEKMRVMGQKIATQIENELKYPGRIRITLMRETRVIEYAK